MTTTTTTKNVSKPTKLIYQQLNGKRERANGIFNQIKLEKYSISK